MTNPAKVSSSNHPYILATTPQTEDEQHLHRKKEENTESEGNNKKSKSNAGVVREKVLDQRVVIENRMAGGRMFFWF